MRAPRFPQLTLLGLAAIGSSAAAQRRERSRRSGSRPSVTFSSLRLLA